MTNHVLLSELDDVPSRLRGSVPKTVDGLTGALLGHPSAAAEEFMRSALHSSTHAVFVGLLVAGVAVLLSLALVPRRFPTLDPPNG